MKSRVLIFLIIFSIILRLVLSVTTYHRDLAAYTTSAKMILTEGHLFDLYDAVLRPDPKGISYQLEFNYQPLAYFLPAAIYAPLTNLVAQTADGLRHTNPYAVVGQSIYLPLLLYKLPFLIADLLILFLLPRLFPQNKRRLVQVLWALNPVAIFVSSLIGQVDMILLLFIVLSLVFHQRKQPLLAAVFLSLSALTKPTALLLIPFLALDHYQSHKSVFKSLLVGVVGFTVYLLGILPFLGSWAFRTTALFDDLISKSSFAGIAISPGYAIPLFFIGYSLSFYLFYTRRLSFFLALGAAIFSSIAFTHFHPQWFLWITPWLIYLALNGQSLLSLVSLLAWVVIWISFGKALHLETFFGLNLSVNLPALMLEQTKTLVLLSRAWLVTLFFALLTSRDETHPV